MNQNLPPMSTGLPHLDEMIKGVMPGDNIVLQVDAINTYLPFVHPYCRFASENRITLNYFRFADHPPVIPDGIDVNIYEIDPQQGFESFISEIFDVIEKSGLGAYYVFDCLSELAVDWYSDRMLGNFFRLTCPYLYDYKTVTYFALLRDHHIAVATDAIHNTAQVVVDIYKKDGKTYLYPKKAVLRFSPTMYMLHLWDNEEFKPVTRSATISEVMTSIPQPWLDFSSHRRDVWSRTFEQAHQCLKSDQRGGPARAEADILRRRLIRMAVTREPQLQVLAEKYFQLSDLVDIGKRMIGTGLIGGKSTGMLLARAILKKESSRWAGVMEPHDSIYIGSDVFYSYLIQNKCWWERRRLKREGNYVAGSDDLRQKLLSGRFPEEILEQITGMLTYFGNSPIIVRSSSLLEDGYGKSFSGKYDSVFCTNQGTLSDRLENFLNAVRTVYASTMKKEALAYREHLGMMEKDEQMALLVQRVSGFQYRDYFLPHAAGVGFSFNPFVWNSEIDPKAGMMRLVFGLGTRAVDRHDDDYTRVVALNAPHKRPETNIDAVRKYAQKRVDVLDLKGNRQASTDFESVARSATDIPLSLFASRDTEMEKRAKTLNMKNVFSQVLTFDGLLSKTNFVKDVRDILQILQTGYHYPVDIEFTVNFISESDYRINLVQCRPFQTRMLQTRIAPMADIPAERVAFRCSGPIIGNSQSIEVHRLIYVVPSFYSALNMQDRYAVARRIGELTHTGHQGKNIVLIGPGRWGTTSPELGVPVSFSEINTVSVICEVAAMHQGLVPDVSLGTHFFNDLVDVDMLYMAIYPQKEYDSVNEPLMRNGPNRLADILPDAGPLADIIHVLEPSGNGPGGKLFLFADSMEQKGCCYFSGE